MSDWKNEAERLRFDERKSLTETARELQKYFPELEQRQVYEKMRRYLRDCDQYKQSTTNVTESIIKDLDKGVSLSVASQKYGLPEKAVEAIINEAREAGYNIVENCGTYRIERIIVAGENKLKRDWSGEKIIRFGLMGDTQINSKYTQLTHLHKLYDVYEAEGIRDVYHTGDIDEGEDMRTGHKYECYTQGADDHVAEIVRVYPKRNDMTTHFITGNHDHSIIKHCGYDIGVSIAKERDDMTYLGQSSAIVELTPNCTLELRHPIDGTAYALSYKLQKMIEAMQGGEKPNIIAVGHYHKAEYLFYRNVHAFQTGTTQAQTPWMRGKQISAHMGGWIVEVSVNDAGIITRIKQEFIPYYTAIKDDYLNWR